MVPHHTRSESVGQFPVVATDRDPELKDLRPFPRCTCCGGNRFGMINQPCLLVKTPFATHAKCNVTSFINNNNNEWNHQTMPTAIR
mmetsp:Transcript_10141/g.27781  ORF Transcript_10141/g.27781 Transcript_10141/m.27781 type:complete len:86 (-) Transcript_10141:90-347(-)